MSKTFLLTLAALRYEMYALYAMPGEALDFNTDFGPVSVFPKKRMVGGVTREIRLALGEEEILSQIP